MAEVPSGWCITSYHSTCPVYFVGMGARCVCACHAALPQERPEDWIAPDPALANTHRATAADLAVAASPTPARKPRAAPKSSTAAARGAAPALSSADAEPAISAVATATPRGSRARATPAPAPEAEVQSAPQRASRRSRAVAPGSDAATVAPKAAPGARRPRKAADHPDQLSIFDVL